MQLTGFILLRLISKLIFNFWNINLTLIDSWLSCFIKYSFPRRDFFIQFIEPILSISFSSSIERKSVYFPAEKFEDFLSFVTFTLHIYFDCHRIIQFCKNSREDYNFQHPIYYIIKFTVSIRETTFYFAREHCNHPLAIFIVKAKAK